MQLNATLNHYRGRLMESVALPEAAARTLPAGAALFGLFVALFALVQFATPGIADNDGYYHIKMAYLMREQGLKPAFTALPQTILNAEDFYDHHLLFHLFLAPFAPVDPAVDGGRALTMGAKLAAVTLPSLAFLAIWHLLRARRVPYAALWALGLFAVSEAFLYRMSMPRAQSGSLLFLALGLHWLLQERYGRLLPLGFLYVWFYNAFPLLPVTAGVYVAAVLLLERRFVWQALVYPLAGVALGLAINPYFPENLAFIAQHLLPKVGESAVRVGNEWYPYETWTLVENSGPALAAFVLGMLAVGWRRERWDRPALVAFGLTVLFGLMLFKSRRFVEYFPPFALIFLALSAAPLLRDWAGRLERARPGAAALLPLALSGLLLLPLIVTLRDARDLMRMAKPADQYAAAALWLRDNTPPGAAVFQTDWDDFTRLFFYHDDAAYTAGLDPTFMQMYDADRYDLWVDVTRGRVDDPGRIIRDEFGAQVVFSDLKHEAFLEDAAADPLLEEVYRDEYAVIFAVRP